MSWEAAARRASCRVNSSLQLASGWRGDYFMMGWRPATQDRNFRPSLIRSDAVRVPCSTKLHGSAAKLIEIERE